MFFRRIVKSFMISSVVSSPLIAVDLSPKYIRLKTDNNGSGIWQMVGVAGFYNNIYSIGYEENGNGSQEYTSFYCDENTKNSVIRTMESSDPKNDMVGKYWLFSISISEDKADLLPLVVDIESSKKSANPIKCDSLSAVYNTNSKTPTETFVYASSEDLANSLTFVKFTYPDGFTPKIIFSLDYNASKIYQLQLTNQSGKQETIGTDLTASTDEALMKNMSVATRPINQVVDLYLNDNPGFGNSTKDARDFISSNHQVPLIGNMIADRSELKLYSYDNMKNQWLTFNSKNGIDIANGNDFNEIQAGKGYWTKYDTSNSIYGNKFLYTLELNSSCGTRCESNFTIKSPSGKSFDYNFSQGDINYTSVTITSTSSILNDAEMKITAIKIADYSILIEADMNSSSKPTIKETSSKNIYPFLNSETSFSSAQEIKSGFVLGDSSVVLTSNSVYSSIAKKGWNLLTIPTSTIRKSVTGLILDWNSTITYTSFSILDEFGINKIIADGKMIGVGANQESFNLANTTAHKAAILINKAIAHAQASGELSSQFFNVRALPIGSNNDKLMIISNDKFTISSDSALTGVTNLLGSTKDLKGKNILSTDNKSAYSNYGQYALLIQPNTKSQFVIDNKSKIEINGIKISVDSNVSVTTNNINKTLKENDINITATIIDHDINGLINEDGSDFILLTSSTGIYVKDTTYTKVYSYVPNSQGSIIVTMYDGTDLESDIKSINLDLNKSFTQTGKTQDLNDTSDVNITTYILDENGSSYVNGNEYLVVSSSNPSIYLFESTLENNVTDDSLKMVFNYEKNISTKGGLLSGVQGNTLSTMWIESNGTLQFGSPTISDITANSFVSDDLLASNALITLSQAFNGTNRYMPTMIIGSESDVNSKLIYWKTLSPIQKVSRWYNEYNLFSTNNQRAYWVYLDNYPATNPIQVITTVGEAPTVQKKYVRTFNNALNKTNNYFSLTNINANVKGISLNSDGNAEENSVYVTASLQGISNLETLDFPMKMGNTPIVDKTMGYSTNIDYFDIAGLNNNLTGIKITATDGRLYTDNYIIPIDVKQPAVPNLKFVSTVGGTGVAESTKIFITSGDQNDTVQYLLFQDRIDDFNGTILTSNSQTNIENKPSNFIMSVSKAQGETGVIDLCKSDLFGGDEISSISVVAVALDNLDISSANFSDIAKENVISMQNTHVLVDVTDANNTPDQIPNVYNENCEPTGSYKGNGTIDTDSGVRLTSYKIDSTVLTYRPFSDAKIGTTVMNEMFLETNVGDLIGKIGYVDRYIGKRFFIKVGSKLYSGQFAASGLHDDSQSAYTLTFESSSQNIGQ